MKKLILFLIAFSSSLCFAEGPIFRHKDARTQLEFENAYQDLRKKDLYMSIDGTYVCIDNPTFCVDRNNNEVRIGSTTAGPSLYVDSNGIVRQASQPSFLAVTSGAQSNVTGDGTVYTVQFASEIYDLNADYNASNYTFTAPVTAKYSLCSNVTVSGIVSTNTDYDFTIVTSNRSYIKSGTLVSGTAGFGFNLCVNADMDANDTSTISLAINGTGKGADISSTGGRVTFSGSLIN